MVRYDQVYTPTAAGIEQLRGGRTTIEAADLDLLVRMDGVLTLGAIAAGMPQGRPELEASVLRMIRAGLLAVRTDDPFSDQFRWVPPSGAPSAGALAESDAATASLERSGYYVRIARSRPGVRPTGAAAPIALVVEDEPRLASFLGQYLRLEGFETRVASHRAEVLTQIRKLPMPDLMLVDVVLPDLDGFDLLARVRQHPQLQHVPVIMLTAKATREAVLRGLHAGADGYVTKPFEPDRLLEAVRTVMGRDAVAPAPHAKRL